MLLGAFVAGLQTPPARRFVQAKVTELLAQQGVTFATDELRYNALDLSTNLRRVRVTSPSMPDAPPFLVIDQVRVDLSLWQVLRGRYVIESARAEGVAVHYFVNAEGNDNLPRPVTDPDAPSEPLDYLIADLVAPGASVRYENRAQDVDLLLPDVSVTVAGNPLNDRHAITIAAGAGTVRSGARRAQLDRMSATLVLGENDVTVERSEIQGSGTRIAASGTVGPFEEPVVDMTVQAAIDTARAAAVAHITDAPAGTVSVEASATGPVDTLSVEARATGRDLAFRGLSGIVLDATAAYQAGRDAVRIGRLEISGPAGAVAGNGEVVWRGNALSRIDASIDGLETEAVMRALALPYRIAARADGRISGQWPGLDYAAADGRARLTLATTGAVAPSTLPVSGRLDVAGQDGRVVASFADVRTAGARFDGRIILRQQTRLDGTWRVQVPEVASTVPAIETFLGRARGSLVPVAMAGAVRANGGIAGTLQSPAVAAEASASALTIGEADGIAVNTVLTYRPAGVTLTRLQATWQEATLEASGTIGLTGRRRLDVTAHANALQVANLLRAAERSGVPATGTVSLQAQVAGTLDRPAATIEVQAESLSAYQEVLGTLDARAELIGRRLDVTALNLHKPQPGGDGTVSVTGSFNLDSQRYTADVRSENVQLLTLTLPDGRPVRGVIELRGNSAGTVADPSGRFTLRAPELTFDGYALGPLTAETTLANGSATTEVVAPRFATSATATVATAQPYAATLTARVNDLDLAALPVTLQTPLAGRLRATATASGPLAEPARGQAEATVDAFAGSWNGQPFAIDGPARVRYAGERLAIDQLRLTARDSSARLSGELPLRGGAAPGRLDIDAAANLATLAQYAPAGTAVSADGLLTIKGTISGSLQTVEPNLVVTLDDGLLLAPALEPGLSGVTGRATIANGEAAIESLTARWGSAAVELLARLPLDLLPALPVAVVGSGGPATLNATVTGLDPAAIPGAPEGVTGRISSEVKVEASRPDLAAANGSIAFRELRVGLSGLTLAQQGETTFTVSSGRLAIDHFDLGGTAGTLTASGTVGLDAPRALDVSVDGGLNIAAVSMVTDQVMAEGDSTIALRARGTLANPDLQGHLALSDGTIVIDEPGIAAEAVTARIELNGRRVTLAALDADVNGGRLTGSGGMAIAAGGLRDVNVELAARDFAFDAPLDLRSLSDSDIRITSQDDDILVAGQVTIQEAGLTGDINFDTGLLATIRARPPLELTPQRSPLLERVLLDVDVDTATPVLVDNNLARAEVTTDVRVVGTPYETGLIGRVTVLQGGEVTLNERRYEIERGQMTFIEERRIFPSFDLQMSTEAGSYDVTLAVAGEPGNTETTLTSSPSLPEPDIMAILVTGRTLDEMRGEEYDIAREQVLSYLTGRVGSSVGRGLERATGLSEVRIEPHLIAAEEDPSARLTLGQELSDDLGLVYSVDLADSDDQIWIATYDLTKRFQTRAVRQNDNSYRLDFTHDIRRGGRPEPRRAPRIRPTVGTVQVPESAPLPAAELRRLLGVEPGDDFNHFAVRDGVTDIKERLREAGWLQARVRLQREQDGTVVNLRLQLAAGPQVEIAYAGAPVSADLQEQVRVQWQRGVFDAQRTDDVAETVRASLMDDNYLQAAVEVTAQDLGADRRRVKVAITPGPRYSRMELAFTGASGIDAAELEEIVDEQGLERKLFTDPTVVTELLEQFYREQGYLNAEIDEPRLEFAAATARVVLAVREGPRFEVSQVAITGNTVLSEAELTAALPVETGLPFVPVAAENALQHIRSLYWERGYNDIRVTYQLSIDRTAGRAGVAFAIAEGRQSVVSDIRIAGNDETSDRLVREQLVIDEGQPLNLRALSRSRKNLYNSGAFSMVDLARVNAAGNADDDDAELIGGLGPAAGQKPVVVDVSVREVQPFQLRYGASFDSEGGIGGVADASNHNSLGKARVLGVSARYDRQVRDGRVYLSQPTLRHWPIQTTASIYYRDERNPATQLTRAFTVERTGLSIQQEKSLANAYVWTYGYRFERGRTFDPLLADESGRLTTVSPLTSTLVREARDEVLDASRGSLTSHALSFSPSWLGSDATFIKYYGQYSHYFPLQPARRKRFSNEILRPRFVFATSVRLGLSRGMGTLVPSTERFFAGGSTSLRGFEQNAVGPVGADGIPTGGDAMLVLNNELRFPLISLLDGVTFVDVGNVFPALGDFSFGDLRKTAGVGLRLRTKWVLVRGDYGFVLDVRAGERKSRFYFSIGQAF